MNLIVKVLECWPIPFCLGNCRRRKWQPTPVLLPGKPHGQRNLVGCSPWGREQSDTTEWLHLHFSLSCIGEGNRNPLQCSCLENPRGSPVGCHLRGHRVEHSWRNLASAAAHPHMTTGKTTALTRLIFAGKVMSLLLNMLSRLVITFLPRSKCLLISWLQSPSAVILGPPR